MPPISQLLLLLLFQRNQRKKGKRIFAEMQNCRSFSLCGNCWLRRVGLVTKLCYVFISCEYQQTHALSHTHTYTLSALYTSVKRLNFHQIATNKLFPLFFCLFLLSAFTFYCAEMQMGNRKMVLWCGGEKGGMG